MSCGSVTPCLCDLPGAFFCIAYSVIVTLLERGAMAMSRTFFIFVYNSHFYGALGYFVSMTTDTHIFGH